MSLIGLVTLSSVSCVQKSYERKVTYILDVSEVKNIKTVGIRGQGKPLSWNTDLEMQPLKKDSFTVTVTCVTGYKFGQVKFVVNDEFELKEKPIRKVIFNENGETIYKATFNIEK